MKAMQSYVIAIIISCALLGSGFSSADTTDLAKQAENLVRDAERNMYGGNIAEADRMLVDALRLIEQGKSEASGNKLMLRVEKKYERTRQTVDKKLKQTTHNTSPSSPNANFSSRLPAGVSKRIRDIDSLLNEVENKGMNYKLRSAEALFEEIDSKYSGQFDTSHPDYVSAKDRFTTLSGSVKAQKTAQEKEKNEAQHSKAAMQGQSAEWVRKFQEFLSYPGNEGHNPDKLVFIPGTSETDKFAEAKRRYAVFKDFYAEYKKTEFPHGKGWKLEELADREAPLRIETFEKDFANRLDSVGGSAGQQIASAMTQLNKDNGWKSDKSIKPELVDSKWMLTIQQQVNQAITALGKESPKALELQKEFDALLAKDKANREIRKQRTFMTPDKYRGADINVIKKKAESLVASNGKEGGKPLRSTVISNDWREETVREWTDTSRTSQRWRTTRSLSSQVAAKTGDGVRLITVAIAKDKRSDGTWGPLYGNLHQYSDPMLEENINKNGP